MIRTRIMDVQPHDQLLVNVMVNSVVSLLSMGFRPTRRAVAWIEPLRRIRSETGSLVDTTVSL